MRAALWTLVAVAAMATVTVLAASAAYTFNNVIEARRDQERNERAKEMIAVMQGIEGKIPSFPLLNRKTEPNHVQTTGSNFRFVRRFGN